MIFHLLFFFFLLRKCLDTGRSGTVVTRERSNINQSPPEMNQLHNHQLLTTCSSYCCNVVVVGSNHKVDLYFVSSFFPIRAPGRYCIHNPNPSHHCMNISRSLSKIVKYMCTYIHTYLTSKQYLLECTCCQSADERVVDQEKKDSHQTLKKEGSYSLPPPAEREGESLLPYPS